MLTIIPEPAVVLCRAHHSRAEQERARPGDGGPPARAPGRRGRGGGGRGGVRGGDPQAHPRHPPGGPHGGPGDVRGHAPRHPNLHRVPVRRPPSPPPAASSFPLPPPPSRVLLPSLPSPPPVPPALLLSSLTLVWLCRPGWWSGLLWALHTASPCASSCLLPPLVLQKRRRGKATGHVQRGLGCGDPGESEPRSGCWHTPFH